ncbi:MAG: YihY/virulence factor BrkB family protein, partial [Bacteroidales bacterium]|nr:YihY/virulence factor BrkB family protein [Bacteroidales bacterium]
MISQKFKAVQKFIEEDIWRMRKDNTSIRQFWLIRTTRIFVIAVKRFLTDDCMVKASALTYYSLLSVVPVVALAFAIAKGFGFRETLEEQLHQRLVGHEEVVQWVQDFALSYLDNTKGGMIAGVGVIVLLFSVIKILSDIESSFNDIWGVKVARSMVRKFSDYISFMLVSTVLLVLSSSFMVFMTSSIEVFDLGKIATPIITWASPYILIWVVFTLMFMLMPNTKVQFTSALFGGIIGGSLFLALQFAYITFQIGMSKYNAIYGSFAALPLFLIWMNSSWLIVLLGAELSFAHQNEKSYEFDTDTLRISDDYRRLVSLLVVKYVVDNFKNELPAPSMSDLSVS